ncbi:MAG TPA: hypothetical protein VKU77_26335 [Streptosporangiaceae bacterium]|jgi:hypothetical protein|nr:hypothetical protein [Streptosporangiaceae bacterium]
MHDASDRGQVGLSAREPPRHATHFSLAGVSRPAGVAAGPVNVAL